MELRKEVKQQALEMDKQMKELAANQMDSMKDIMNDS